MSWESEEDSERLNEALGKLAEEKPETIWDPDSWGEIMVGGRWGKADHIRLRVSKVPEGALQVLTCMACGGINQRIADLVEAHRKFTAGELTDAREIMEASVNKPLVDEFVIQHLHCAESPIQHHVPEEVSSLTELAVERAKESIAEGERASAFCTILTSDGVLMVLDIGGLPPADHGRMRAMQEMHFQVRRMVRAAGLDVLALTFVTEAWVSHDTELMRPSKADDRKEVLVVTEMTNDYVRTGFANISRVSGWQDEGAGLVGDVEWMDGGAEHNILEGLLAT